MLPRDATGCRSSAVYRVRRVRSPYEALGECWRGVHCFDHKRPPYFKILRGRAQSEGILFAILVAVLGRRAMVASRDSKSRREGSIPSRPAGSSSKGKTSGLHPDNASSILADSTVLLARALPGAATRRRSRIWSNGRTAAFQAADAGSIPAVRSNHQPILERGSPAATRRARARLPLGSPCPTRLTEEAIVF